METDWNIQLLNHKDMKTRRFLTTMLCSLMLGASFVSCSEDDNEVPQGPNKNGSEPTIDPVEQVAYILNEGLWGSNNAGIALFYPNQKGLSDANYYQTMNGGKPMGDLANAMMEEDDNIYVVLNESKYVARLDKSIKEQARYYFAEGEGKPRCIAVEDGYAYVTQHGGQVSKILIKDMSLVATFKGGDNLEGIVEEDGKLYVANAWKVDGSNNYLYNEELLVIDATTMAQTGTISVVPNPVQVQEINEKIYVISQGDYAGVQAALQVIDTKAGTSKEILKDVDKITEGNNGLIYGVRSTYDANWNTINSFFSYNPSTGVVSETSFLKDAPSALSSTAIYLLEVDEETGHIYVGTSDYTNTGTIYQFDKDGKLLQSFDSGGINPSAMIFLD